MASASDRRNAENGEPDGIEQNSQKIRMEEQPTQAAMPKEAADVHAGEADAPPKIPSNTVATPLASQDLSNQKSLHSDQYQNYDPVSGAVQISARHPPKKEKENTICPDDSSYLPLGKNTDNERSAKDVSLREDSEPASQESEDMETDLGDVDSSPKSDVNNSPEQAFLRHLGLKKVARKQKETNAHVRSLGDVSANGNNVGEMDKQYTCASALDMTVDSLLRTEVSSDQNRMSQQSSTEQPGLNLSMIKSVRVIKPDNGNAKGDKTDNGSEAYEKSNGDQDSSSAKKAPVCIKVRLEENDVTIICCPVAFLLQHKGCVDVSLQENDQDAYSITCRKCGHEVTDPYAMLHHLKAEHRIQGCLQKLLNLNSQHLGCMSRPVCVNVPGVLTLPEGLADMEQGVVRFNSHGVPRLSFVCRLCPLNFHTARGLSAHHQYFMRNLVSRDVRDLPVLYESKWVCKLCPRQFASFQSYYAHHKWMRVTKDLFVNTNAVNKKTKKFEVIDVSGKIVASLEVPKTHNLAVKTWPEEDSDIGWGCKASPLRPTVKKLLHRNSEGSVQVSCLVPETRNSDSVTANAFPEPGTQGSSKEPTEDKMKKKAPPLYRTLDNLCRKLAERVDPSADTKTNLAGDKDDEEHEYMCAICHKTFPRLPQMQGHMGSHVRRHRVMTLPTPTVPPVSDPPYIEQQLATEPKGVVYKCGTCSEVFPKLDEMQAHMESHNSLHPAANTSMRSLDAPFSETVKLVSFTCDLCHWSCSSERKFWDHRRTHDNQQKSDDDPTSIDEVDSTPESSSDAQKKTMYVCYICSKSFTREINLKFHMRKHEQDDQEHEQAETHEVSQAERKQQYICSACGRSFSTSRQLKSHRTWHSKIQNLTDSPPVAKKDNPGSPKRYYTCSICNKRCNSIWGLGLHKKKHLKSPKLQTCHVSPGTEPEKVKRKSAERIAPKKKSSGVRAKGNSPKLKIHAPEFVCRYCQQRFSSRRLYANHMTSHSNNNTSKGQQVARSASSKKAYSKQDKVSKQTRKKGEAGSSSLKGKPIPEHDTELQGRASFRQKQNGDLIDSALELRTDLEQDTNSAKLEVGGDVQENDKASSQLIEKEVNVTNVETAASHSDLNGNKTSEACYSSAKMDINQAESSTDKKKVSDKVATDTGDKLVGQVSNVSRTTTTEMDANRLTTSYEQVTMKATEPTCINTAEDGMIVNSPSQTELDFVMANAANIKPLQTTTTKPKVKEDMVGVNTLTCQGVSTSCEDTSSNDTNHDSGNMEDVSSEMENKSPQSQIAEPSFKETHSHEESPEQGPVQPSPLPTTEFEKRPNDLAKTSKTSTQSIDVSEQPSRDGNPDKTTPLGHVVGAPETDKVASESSDEPTCDQTCTEKSEPNTDIMEVSAPQNQYTPRAEVCASSDETSVEESDQKMDTENALSQKASKTPQMQDTGDITSDTKEILNNAGQIPSAELVPHSGKSQLQTAEVSTNGEDIQTNVLSVECVSSDPLMSDANKVITYVLNEPPPETKSVPEEEGAFGQANCEQVSSSNNPKPETQIQIKSNKQHLQNSEVPDNACDADDRGCFSDSSVPAIDVRVREGSHEPLVQAGSSSRNLTSRVRFSCEICNKTFNKKFQLRGHKGKHGKTRKITPKIVATSQDIESRNVEDILAPDVGVDAVECDETQQGNGEHLESKDQQNSTQTQSGVACTVKMPTQDKTSWDVKRPRTFTDHSPSEIKSTNLTLADSQDDVIVAESSPEKDQSDTPKILKCPNCKRTFTHVNQLNAHQKFHSYIKAKTTRLLKKSNTGKKPRTCEICNRTFKDYKRLSCHKRVHVSRKLTDSKKTTEGGGQQSEASQQEGPSTRATSTEFQAMEPKTLKPRKAKTLPVPHGNFICKFCNKGFYHLFRFRHHLTTAHPTAKSRLCFLKPFVCEVCGKAFSNSKQRTCHMKIHATGRSHSCQSIKEKIALQDTDHSYYKKPPTAKTEHVPAECGEKQKQDLNQASKNTSNDGASVLEYKCRFCQTTFKSQNQLAGHMNLHKKYICQVCDVSFPLARQLWGHLKIHGGLRKGLIDSGKETAPADIPGMTLRPVTRHFTTSNSNALLKKIIRMYLFEAKPRKTRFKKRPSPNGFKPKRTLQRALLKHQQAKMQKILGVLRKSVVLEIDADSHKLVYDCKECHKVSVSHKAILRHFLAKHLDEIKKPVASGAEKQDKTPVTDQRFRNKSKVGCPVCKSSGFQCHLHNNDDVPDAKSYQGHFVRDDLSKKSKSDASPVPIKLIQDNGGIPKHTPSYRFRCSLCPFTSKSEAGLDSHQKFHRGKTWKQVVSNVPADKGALGCPWCSFKAKNVYALAAHSRVHRVKEKGKKVLRKNPEIDIQGPSRTQSLAPGQSAFPHLMSETSPSPSWNTKTVSDSAPQQKQGYVCCICSKCFISLGTYQAHLKKHTESFPFKCSQCPCRFPSVDKLHKHMIIHAAKNPYRCTECPYSSANKEALQSHLEMHSGAKERKDRKADWSAYLSQVLHARVPPTEAAYSKDGLKTAESMPEIYHVAGALSSDESMTSSSKSGEPPAKQFRGESNADLENPGQIKETEGSLNRLSDSPSEYFACSQCKDFQASSKEEWDEHMTTVHKKTSKPKLKCSMCRYKTTSKEYLEQHMKHHSHETLQCNSCSYSTPHKHLMIRHVQTVHRHHRPFRCMLCTYSTAYSHHLKRHSEKHKDPNFRCRYRTLMQKGDWQSAEVSSTGYTPMICRECGKQLQNKKTLRNHYLRVHGKRLKFTAFSVARWEEDISTSSDANSEQKEQPTFMVIQQNEATCNDNLFECNVCSYSFKDRSELNRHLAEGHLETRSSIPCQCPQCGLVTGSGQLEAHMLIHQEENLLQCSEDGCNFKTAKTIHLDRHRIKNHAQRKAQIQCHLCQAIFPDTSSLRMHSIQNHSDQASSINARSPFKCPQCPYFSPNQKDASRHFSLHNYNLPFKCEHCIFSTSTAAAIATHRKIHRHPRCSLPSTPTSNSPSQSPKVKSISPSKSADVQDSPGATIRQQLLPKHVFVTDSGKKLYECRYCQRFFDVAEAWQRHELRHRIEWPPC